MPSSNDRSSGSVVSWQVKDCAGLIRQSGTLALTIGSDQFDPKAQRPGSARGNNQQTGAGAAENVVTLSRAGGAKLGARLGNAASATAGVQVVMVEPMGQAAEKLPAGQTVVKINGSSVLGFQVKDCASLIRQSDTLALTIGSDRFDPKAQRPGSVRGNNPNTAAPGAAAAAAGENVVALSRAGGAMLGARLGNAASATTGIQIAAAPMATTAPPLMSEGGRRASDRQLGVAHNPPKVCCAPHSVDETTFPLALPAVRHSRPNAAPVSRLKIRARRLSRLQSPVAP